MSKSTISTFELFKMFPDAEAARVYMEAKRWPDGVVCPACDEAKRITTRKGGFKGWKGFDGRPIWAKDRRGG